ncbi:GPI-anchored small secreted protein [Laccaria bicolor S238N-H82]|uniref:GPI-anchored small secreted protein n=1 Tax=Laccaria bicolor (strain S238N-H82 / ATCC MYA-4686) TaxID=486041 RepID=B0DSE6_LACBS|nr:GPI-anchored small secreted protein [Laccaria bicolor S238N-H82]EDR02532.1 GPI-anchored small secreted protein [Laccaria bicolor S238N-H82]|eukprot:XP_001886895.1 GPI-anchored small secreted protein [Laccaria bicolor S238N-H82]
MHFSTVTLVSSILLASQAVALVPRSPFVQLFPRQTTDACTASCSIFDDALNACTTTTCLCTATVANGLSTCVNCYYSNTPTAAVLTSANKLISTFEDTCSAFTLPAISVKTSSGGATTAVTTVVSTAPRVTSTTNTPITVTSVAAGTTVSPPKVTVTAVTADGASTTAGASSSSSGNVIPGLTSGAISAQCQSLVVPAAVVLGGFLAMM